MAVYHRQSGVKFQITDDMKKNFNEDGYIIVRNLYSNEEISRLKGNLEDPNSELMKRAYSISDGEDGLVKMILWNHPGKDYSGMMGRCEKIVDSCEELIGGEVYHYQTKLVLKEAFTGGAFQWHQDYGYWYLNGVLRPDVISVQVGIDDVDRGNGGLQVIRGSHKMGRVDHGRIGEQAGADQERIEEALKVMEKVFVELKSGDALFFHCNLLHTSAQNRSARRRWALISCYNRADNNPFKDDIHPKYTPLIKVPDSAILECDDFVTMDGKWFHLPNKNTWDYIPEKK